jgi:tripartite-type tricarboxylate transporter receptor subunit TctC
VSTSQAISAGVYPNLTADVIKSFAPVTLLAQTPYVLVINPEIPAKSVRELIAYGKANPGKLVLGTSGAGNSDDIIGQEFARLAGIEMIRVPYRGAGPAIPDLLAGRINVTFFSPLPTKQHVESGKLRLLAVTMKERSPAMPNVPSIAEQGLPNFDFPGWYGLAVPVGTSREIIAKLQRAAAAALTKPAVVKFLKDSGLTPGGGPPADFGAFLASETARWSELARKMGVKP